jgi:hypothetical protein
MTMAPDTQDAVIKINVKLLTGLITVIMSLIGGVAWGVRLEYRTETNVETMQTMQLDMVNLRNDRLRDNDRLTKAESQLNFILQGIEEIKSLLRDKKS